MLKIVVVTILLFAISVDGRKENNIEQNVVTSNGNGCSDKKAEERERIVKSLNLLIVKKLKTLQKLEVKRLQMMKLLRALCRKQQSTEASQKPILNQIFFNLIKNNRSFEKIVLTVDKNKVWERNIPIDLEYSSLKTSSKKEISEEDKNLEHFKREIELNYGNKNKNNAKRDKIDWKSSEISLGGKNLLEIPKQDLELILQEMSKYANCPTGKVFNTDLQKCIPILKPIGGEIELRGDIIESNSVTTQSIEPLPELRTFNGIEKMLIKNKKSPGTIKIETFTQTPFDNVAELFKTYQSTEGVNMNPNLITSEFKRKTFIDSKPCKPSKEDIRLVVEALKTRFKKEKIETESKIDPKIIGQELANIKNYSKIPAISNLPKLKPFGVNAYDQFDSGKLKNIKREAVREMKSISQNIRHHGEQQISIANQRQGQTSSTSHHLSVKTEDLPTLSLTKSNKEKSLTNSNGNMKITTNLHPEIKLGVLSKNKTMKLTPFAISGSNESIDQMMKKLIRFSQRKNNLKLLLEQFPELKNKVTIVQNVNDKSSNNETSDNVSERLQIVDEGEIPLMRQKSSKIEFNPNVKIIHENIPSKLIIRATLPNGQVIKVGERNITDPAILNSNGSLTIDKLGIDLKNFYISKEAKESLQNMTFKIEKSVSDPIKVEHSTKKIKPAKFKLSVPFKASKRGGSELETTTASSITTLSSTLQKSDKLTTDQSSTQIPSSTTDKEEQTGTPKLISNLFKPVKDFKKLMEKKKKQVHKLFSLSDQDHKRSVDIPATSKEDIEKILEIGAPLMELKSVVGKTLDSQGIFGKMLDEQGSTNIVSLTSTVTPVKTTYAQKKSTLSSPKNTKSTTGVPPTNTTKQVTSSSNLTLLPLKVIQG